MNVKRYQFIMVVVLVGILAVAFFSKRPVAKALISPITINDTLNLSLNDFNFYDAGLSKIVDKDLKDEKGDYAVVIEGLGSGSKLRYYQNETSLMPAASLYKVVLITAAYDLINQGKLAKTDQIIGSEKHLIDVLGSKEFGYEDLQGDSITYSVSDTLKRIAEISDNYAAIMLAEKIGWDNVRLEAQKLGMTQTSIKDPITTSAADMALYLRELYSGHVVSSQASSEISDLLASSKINDRIPDQLPDSLKIAHKTGELSKVRNDAGIVYLDKYPYIIVLMSQNLEFEDDGVTTLSNLSKDVYDYFSAQL